MKVSVILPNHNEPEIDAVYCGIRRLYPDWQVIISNDPEGKGKGWAIREGLKQAVGDYIIFFDGDGDIPIEQLAPFKAYLEGGGLVAVGVKSLWHLPFRRKIITFLSRLFIKVLFNLPVRDTQTGIKLFHRGLLPDWKTNGYAFDIEILKQIPCWIREIPVECSIGKGKGLRELWRTFREVIKIR